MNYKFYKNWKNKTPLEKKYIKSLENALIWLKKQSFIEEVLAVYVKGSFVYREINKESDVDLFTVVKDKKALYLLKESRNKHKKKLSPIEILPTAIEELEKNERFENNGMKGKPDNDTTLLPYFKLIYGKPLKIKGWKVRSEQKIYDDLKKFILNKGIPLYKKDKFGFRQLGKAFMHLVYWEERLKGRKFPSSWKAIKKACPNNKLLQQTVHFRFHPTKNEKIRKKYIEDVIDYLKP